MQVNSLTTLFNDSFLELSSLLPSELGIDKKPFSFMQTRLPKRSYHRESQLNGISKRCDWFIHGNNIIKKKDVPRTIFLCMHKLESFTYFVDELLPSLNSPFVLVIAGEDQTFPKSSKDIRFTEMASGENQRRYHKLLKSPYLSHCFVENLDAYHKKLSPLPLGQVPKTPPLTPKLNIDFSKKLLKVLCVHKTHQGEQFNDRRKVTERCQKEWVSFVDYYPLCYHHDFIKHLKNYSFCLCVHGGGIDPSPKAWEALAMGCIPVIAHSTLDKAYSKFPVAFVDNWDSQSLSEAKLKQWLKKLRPFYENPEKRAEVIRMLSLDYWWKEIISHLPAGYYNN